MQCLQQAAGGDRNVGELDPHRFVPVAPLYKGWTVYRVNSILTTGSAYITDGIKGLIAVDNIDLAFPGYSVPAPPARARRCSPRG